MFLKKLKISHKVLIIIVTGIIILIAFAVGNKSKIKNIWLDK